METKESSKSCASSPTTSSAPTDSIGSGGLTYSVMFGLPTLASFLQGVLAPSEKRERRRPGQKRKEVLKRRLKNKIAKKSRRKNRV